MNTGRHLTMLRSLGVTLALSLAGLQLLAVMIIVVSSYITSERALLGHARDLLSDVALTTREHSRGFLEPARSAAEMARRLAENDIVARDDTYLLEKLLFHQLQTAPQFAGLYYGDEAGNFIYVMRSDGPGEFRTKIIHTENGKRTTNLVWRDPDFALMHQEIDEADDFDPRNRPWYKKVRAEMGVVWAEPYIFFTSQQPGITVAAPVSDAAGELKGVIGVDIEISEISNFLSKLKIGQEGRGIIINYNGDVIAHPKSELIKTSTYDGNLRFVNIREFDDPIARAAFSHLMDDGNIMLTNETSASFEFDGKDYVSTMTPTLTERLPWTIGVYAPEEDFTWAIKANRRQNIVIALCVAFVTALVGLALAGLIHKPIRELANRAIQISRGQVGPPVPFPKAFREVDRAGLAFNRMSRSLLRYKSERDQLTEELRAASRILETRVAERTAELAAVNAKLQAEIADRSAAQSAASNEAALHRETSQRLRVAMESAKVANSAKSRFLSSMSHELRNPLNAIIGFSEILLKQGDHVPEEKKAEFLQHIKSSGMHLHALVNDVLDLEKVDLDKIPLRMESVDIKSVVEQTAAEQSVLAVKNKIKIIDNVADFEAPLLHSDQIRLRQVIGNLLSNAIKYNHPGGQVRIDCTRRVGALRITVSDTGHGIPKELHGRVFEPFDRLGVETSNVEGTGVGLTLSKKLIESLGGRIGFESEPGTGSKFWIEIPILSSLDRDPAETEVLAPLQSVSGGRVHRVLYIDDNEINLKLIETYFSRRSDISLSTVLTGTSGIELAEEEHFDIMLVDINLPDISGFDVLEQLRRLRPESVIIAVSADAMLEQVKRGMQAGFDDYITKPVELASLEQKINSFLS